MKFRPCIDIHNGQVKQIVGSTLNDANDSAGENFTAQQDAGYFAQMYKEDGLTGGHVILLNGTDSPYYDITKEQALLAIESYRNGLQVGGGINLKNAIGYLEEGATHVIVTSFVFKDGSVNMDNLYRMSRATGRERLVLDVSCRKRDGKYYIVTDRWQKFTEVVLDEKILDGLSKYCDEFLIHAVDVEGRVNGIEEDVVKIMGKMAGFKMTYAGGISSLEDIEKLADLAGGAVDFTVGSALDIFGGKLSYKEIAKKYR